ncbi:MAG: helix-turn-helix transcriptional regulator [Planctomycetota bacterium]
MAKRVARKKVATTEQVARWRVAVEEEEACHEATLAQAREMKAAALLARQMIGELKAAREARGLSLADLKARTGMTRESISRLENHEEPNPQLSTLVRLASAIGVTLTVSVEDPAR